mmetsp:Transcript_85795/g.139101  ORF Transcript_85795/g.139101 Transcript_85795/m.139101 type:complete len:238 (-) Transcript_85795:1117-1830(-)
MPPVTLSPLAASLPVGAASIGREFSISISQLPAATSPVVSAPPALRCGWGGEEREESSAGDPFEATTAISSPLDRPPARPPPRPPPRPRPALAPCNKPPTAPPSPRGRLLPLELIFDIRNFLPLSLDWCRRATSPFTAATATAAHFVGSHHQSPWPSAAWWVRRALSSLPYRGCWRGGGGCWICGGGTAGACGPIGRMWLPRDPSAPAGRSDAVPSAEEAATPPTFWALDFLMGAMR